MAEQSTLQGNGRERKVATITLTLDLDTWALDITGVVPGAQCALAMVRMAEDEYKRVINHGWLADRGAPIARASVLPRGPYRPGD